MHTRKGADKSSDLNFKVGNLLNISALIFCFCFIFFFLNIKAFSFSNTEGDKKKNLLPFISCHVFRIRVIMANSNVTCEFSLNKNSKMQFMAANFAQKSLGSKERVLNLKELK